MTCSSQLSAELKICQGLPSVKRVLFFCSGADYVCPVIVSEFEFGPCVVNVLRKKAIH